MSLRQTIHLTAWMIRISVSSLSLLAASLAHEPWLGVLGALAWLVVSGPLLRSSILPFLFPATACPGCRRIIPLTGRWKCGDHYTDSQDRHILRFRCPHGHRLEGFDCPRCRATILVQHGDATTIRHGSAIRLRALRRGSRAQGGLALGQDERGHPVSLGLDRLAWHMAITGGTGRGKSTLLGHLIRQLLEEDVGLTVLDPGGDLARHVVQHIPPEREGQVLYVDLADREHPFPLNILSAHDPMEAAMLVEELLGVFHRLHGSAWGPLLEHQLRMALKTAMLAKGTLRDVYRLFNDTETRSRILRRVTDPDLRAFWTGEFPAVPTVRRSSVTNKLAPIVFHPILGPVLCAPTCAVNGDTLIGNRRILIVNLATGTPGDEVTTLLGTFLVQKVLAAAYRQARLPPERRVPHVLVVDEFQRFMHRAAAFDQILAEARKFRLSLIVANQYVEQLSPAVRAALVGNVGCLAAFRVGHRDAAVLAPEFTSARPEELMELERGQCLVRIGTDWTLVRTPPPAPRPRPEDDPTPRIVEATRRRFPCRPAGGRAVAAELSDEGDDFVH